MYIPSTTISDLPKTAKAPKQNRLQFGSLSTITPFLKYLDKQPLAELVFKDIAAFNLPKIALARTWKERGDTATLELSNTAITLLLSLVMPYLLRKPIQKITGITEEQLKRDIPFAQRAATQTATKLARLGVSFGFFFPFAAAFWAAPFFRNWLTQKRTKTANFESLIGFDNVKSKKPRRLPQEEMLYQKQMAWKILGSGIALGTMSVGGFGLLAKGAFHRAGNSLGRQLANQLEGKWQKGWNRFFNYFDLKGKGANQIEGVPAQLLFWGLPAYLGWIHGARSEHERRERLLQSANALCLFFLAPKLTKLLWNRKFLNLAGKKELWSEQFNKAVLNNMLPKDRATASKVTAAFENKVTNLKYEDIEQCVKGNKEALTNLKNWQFAVSGLGIPITSLALVQLFNFAVTKRKINASVTASEKLPNVPEATAPTLTVAPFTPIQNKAQPSMAGRLTPGFTSGVPSVFAQPQSQPIWTDLSVNQRPF